MTNPPVNRRNSDNSGLIPELMFGCDAQAKNTLVSWLSGASNTRFVAPARETCSRVVSTPRFEYFEGYSCGTAQELHLT